MAIPSVRNELTKARSELTSAKSCLLTMHPTGPYDAQFFRQLTDSVDALIRAVEALHNNVAP
jgi:hypothetical protein